MTRNSISALVVAAALGASLTGCGRNEDLAPPQVLYGESECEQCRMIISEEPFAAAAVVVSADGVRKASFDDVGCLVEYVAAQAGGAQITAYVKDYQTKAWVDASRALFVRSGRLKTPMASHAVALGERAAADRLLQQYPGRLLSYDELRAALNSPEPAADHAEGAP